MSFRTKKKQVAVLGLTLSQNIPKGGAENGRKFVKKKFFTFEHDISGIQAYKFVHE